MINKSTIQTLLEKEKVMQKLVLQKGQVWHTDYDGLPAPLSIKDIKIIHTYDSKNSDKKLLIELSDPFNILMGPKKLVYSDVTVKIHKASGTFFALVDPEQNDFRLIHCFCENKKRYKNLEEV